MDRFKIASPEDFDPDMFDITDDAPDYNEPEAHAAPAAEPRTERRRPEPQPERREEPRQRRAPEQRRPAPAPEARRAMPASDRQASNGRQKVSKEALRPKRDRMTVGGFLTDARTRIFVGILLGLVTVYLLVVTISYFTNAVHDQSAVLSNTFAALADTPDKVNNAGGPFGAWISEMLISQWMGVATFILIFYLAVISLALLKVRRVRFWPFTMRCLLTTIALSIVLGLITYEVSSPIMWGGRHGHFFNEMLVNVTGIWGAIGVSVLMVAMVGILFYKSLRRGYRKIRVLVVRRRHRMALAHQAAAEERERQRAEREAAEAAEARRRAVEQAHAQEQTIQEHRQAEESDIRVAEPDEDDAPVFIDGDDVEPEEIPVVVAAAADAAPENLEKPGRIMTLGDMEIECSAIEQATEITQEVTPPPTAELYDPRLDLSHYQMPSLDILIERERKENNVDADEQEENKQRIIKTLRDYGIEISSIKATVGPTVTLYEIVPAEGVRISKIKNLEDDIALSLSALGIRIIAPIPGKGTVGIEVPNKDPQTVSIRSILGSAAYQNCKMDLPMAMGSTISNEVFIADLTKMPHLLVAGATGMGKSVGLNTIIASLLYKRHPAELKFVLVDPKMVEFSLYSKLERHYLAKLPGEDEPIITDTSKVVATLNSLCLEMDNRYTLLKTAGCRNIKEYNYKFTHRSLNPEKGHRYLPYIVVIVDEFADLLMTAGKEVETPIARIAQKARAVGIHMILATQRPSANIITGVIKANFPGRIAFRVFQMVDSRTILDSPGANQLIGKGDMLFSNNGKKERVQCAFIDTPEVEALCEAVSSQAGYDSAYELPEFIPEDVDPSGMSAVGDRDPLFEDIARYVVMGGTTASTSSVQRRYKLGYNRAGRIMDQLEEAGIVGPAQGGKPRQVLIDSLQLERLLEIPM